MTRSEKLLDHLRRALEGGAWHGASLLEAVAGVSPEVAAARVVPGGHSVWEQLLHATAWTHAVRRRLAGEAVELAEREDWPPIGEVGEAGWAEARRAAAEAFAALEGAVRGLGEDDLDRTVPGRDYPAEFMLWGLAQHLAYHAGQVGILKRAAAARG
jgi:uncharacterized damage-inducible protein DinB